MNIAQTRAFDLPHRHLDILQDDPTHLETLSHELKSEVRNPESETTNPVSSGFSVKNIQQHPSIPKALYMKLLM